MSPQVVTEVIHDSCKIFSALNMKVDGSEAVPYSKEKRQTLIKCVISPESHQRRILCPKRATNGNAARKNGTTQRVGLLHFENGSDRNPRAYEHATK
jgi:hypothetical protein